MIALVNIYAVPPASTTPQALRFCSGASGYLTSPADTPASTLWRPGLQYPYHMKREVFGTINAGASRTNSGDVVVLNLDGRLDAYDAEDWGFAGQAVEVFVGEPSQPFTSFTKTFRGVIESVNFSWDKMTVKIKDRQKELDRVSPILPKYQGTNAGATGVEGGANDLKGKYKPVCLGACKHVTPLRANSAAQIYQVHFRSVQAIPAVYSNGLAMTATGADYATPALLAAATIASGGFATCLAYGLFRINASNGTTIAADVQGDNVGGYVSDAAGILRRIMEMHSWVADTDFSTADLAALAAKNSAVQGVYETNGPKGKDLMDKVCAGPWFWFCPDRLGVMRFGRIEAPSGTPAANFSDAHLIDLERITNDLAGPPWGLVTMNCEVNFTPMREGDIAAAVSADRQSWLLLDTRASTSTADGNPDAAVLARHPFAESQEFTGYFSSMADGTTEAQRRATFRGAARRGFSFKLAWNAYGRLLELGQVISLSSRRLGLNATPMFITAIEDIPEQNLVEVTACA